ncbi:hypothetical protein CDD82_6316 [Ophiocordyceps australis]|uniref:Flavoprotein domain-containing protein n=1 Tax=Ophiocordyceps australis TaxID=1399860 RepID=A0A2C5ZR68_9HYPO|nr:hypothetical protein CDD82_6316 [Ophiocordyceps australis]
MNSHHRKLHLLVVATGPRDTSWAQALIVRLSKDSDIEIRAIVDDVVPRLTQTIFVMENRSLTSMQMEHADDVDFYRQQAYELVAWADLMVCLPLGADGIAKMIAGIADTVLGEVLRGWNIQKRIVLVPGMSTHMWANPTTKRHLGKLRRKWSWIRVMTPILWHYEGAPSNSKRVPNWNGFDEVLSVIRNQSGLLCLGRDVEMVTGVASIPGVDSNDDGGVNRLKVKLPPEIWTMILDHAGDWELAKALGIYTNLPVPQPWRLEPLDPGDALKVYEHELSWTVLTCGSAAICKKLSQSPPQFQDLPAVVVKLIIRFALIDVLAYMEANRPDLFKTFDGTTLPTNASVYYPRTDVLDYWKQSAWFRDKHVYDNEAVDGASKNGHIRVLDWWRRRSDLPLRYTEAALEQASGRGHLLVLEWWRDAAAKDERIVLRPGRSLLWASQHGKVDVLRWWDASGIPVAYDDGVAKVASRWGRVEVLETWRQLRGDNKVVYDADVLISSTMYQHVGVLDWWRMFAHGELEGMDGQRRLVEFRTCNIEEALEDSIGNQSKARQWWEQYGLNLRMRNEEWLQTRYL